jgi:hypothetical protein
VQLPRGLRKATRAREHAKGAQLSAVEGFFHL